MAEHALDAVAVTIAAEVAVNGFAAIGLGRDDRQDAVHQQIFADSITVIALVGQQRLGLGDGDRLRRSGHRTGSSGSWTR